MSVPFNIDIYGLRLGWLARLQKQQEMISDNTTNRRKKKHERLVFIEQVYSTENGALAAINY